MLTTVILVADVPDTLSGPSVQAAAVAFAQTFESDIEGAAVAACTVDGVSVLPSAADEYNAAREALDALSAGTGSIKPADLKAAMARLDKAARALEAADVAASAPVPVGTPPAAIVAPADQPGAVHPDAAETVAATTTANAEEPADPNATPAPSPADVAAPSA